LSVWWGRFLWFGWGYCLLLFVLRLVWKCFLCWGEVPERSRTVTQSKIG
jgi:hypothetical protein